MKVLFVSNSSPDKPNHLFNAMRDLCDAKIIYKNHKYNYKKRTRTIGKIGNRLAVLKIIFFNIRIIIEALRRRYNIILVVKGLDIFRSTLKLSVVNNPNIKLVNWSLDDMYALHNRNNRYKRNLPWYDLVVTTKSYNCNKDELPSLGAKKILYVNQAFNKNYHKPLNNNTRIIHSYDILFIGYAENDRYEYLKHLALNGIEVNVFGTGWNNPLFNNDIQKLKIHYKPLLGHEYVEALSSSKISLCFLRKINRDLHTSRSIEIPACQGFMLAERTVEHLMLFKEDHEAAFFDNKDELLSKVKYYLQNEDERKRIAYNGYRRCIDSDYSYHNMSKKIINELNSI